MKIHAAPLALLSLLAISAVAQTPPAQEPAANPPRLDLGSDSIRKVVRDTAATQFADARVTPADQTVSKPKEVQYVPPEKPAEMREVSSPQPPTPALSGPLAEVIDIAVSELLGTDRYGDVDAANEILRCKVQKETKSVPQGPIDVCPRAD